MSGAVAGWAAALALVLAAPAAQANVVSNAQTGTLGATISSLTLTLGSVAYNVTGGNFFSNGTVAPNGIVTIPSTNPVALPVPPLVTIGGAPGLSTGLGTLTLSSAGPLGGAISPSTGAANLSGPMQLVEDVPLTLAGLTPVTGTLHCVFPTIPVSASTATTGGSPYDQVTGALTLAQSALTLGTPTCGALDPLLAPLTGAVQSALGLTAGTGSLDLGLLLNPILKAGPVAVLLANPVIGTVPFSTVLDASSSVVPAGVKEYDWDTNGDGVIDQITTTPKLSIPIASAGLLTTAVTVIDVNGDSSRAVALITGLLGAVTGGGTTGGGTTGGGTTGGGTTGGTPGGGTIGGTTGGSASALSAAKVISLPSARRCVSRRRLMLRLRVPAGTTIKRVTVRIGNGRTRALQGKVLRGAAVSLRGLRKGRYTVVVKVTTADGRTVTLKRTYRTCVPTKKSHQRRRRH